MSDVTKPMTLAEFKELSFLEYTDVVVVYRIGLALQERERLLSNWPMPVHQEAKELVG